MKLFFAFVLTLCCSHFLALADQREKSDKLIARASATALNPLAHVSAKKGFVYSGRDPHLFSKLSALGVGWFYTWNPYRPEEISNSMVFTPQIWGKRGAQDNGLLNSLKTVGLGDSGALLGFNEPDLEKQASMSVDEALDLWPALQATGRRLGSPAMAGNPLKEDSWLRSFLKGAQLRNYHLDFIALHWYGPPDSERFLAWVDEVHQTFGMPIWITEFAVADWAAKEGGMTRYSTADVERFMVAVIPELEKRDFVEHYSWKTREVSDSVMGTSALFNDNGSLTDIGLLYSKF